MQYIVRKGDSLSAIAARFQVPLGKLLAANPQITNPDRIEVGQSIWIPGAGGGELPPAPPPTEGVTDAGLVWGAKVSPSFRQKTVTLAAELGVDAGDLMSVMAFESGETFSPSVRNPTSGAVGLIQFMPRTAKALGTTTAKLAGMTAEEQLDYVARYLRPYVGRLRTLEDLYMAVLWPAAVGKANTHVLFAAGSAAYAQNAALDADGNGEISKAEAAAKVRAKRVRGAQFATPAAPRARAIAARTPRRAAKPRVRAHGARTRGMRALGPSADPIEHVVVLMLENRSFDQYLGSLQPLLAAKGQHLDGIDPAARPRENFLQSGPPFQQLALTAADRTLALSMPDPMHELANVKLQLGADNAYFVLDYALSYPGSTKDQRALVMRYFSPGDLPALHGLAESYTVCDRWYASVPGPTWTNRFFVHSGTSLGRVEMPHGIFEPNLHLYHQDTIYDRLNERGIEWRIYYGDVPQSALLMHQWAPWNALRYSRFANFAQDVAGPAHAFPPFVFIEPSYFGDDANDDHPPHDVLRGQALIDQVYTALRSNEELFASTLLVVLYDEHGGFYDHVPPPAAVPPDQYSYEYDFRRLGVRVPALLVSPWVEARVESTPFDHTSILRYLIDKWQLGALGERTAAANSIGVAIRGQKRTGLPRTLAGPRRGVTRRGARPLRAARVAAPANHNQQALLLFSEYLATVELGDTPAPAALASRARIRGVVAGPRAPREPVPATLVQERVERFLARQAGHAQRPAVARSEKPVRRRPRRSGAGARRPR